MSPGHGAGGGARSDFAPVGRRAAAALAVLLAAAALVQCRRAQVLPLENWYRLTLVGAGEALLHRIPSDYDVSYHMPLASLVQALLADHCSAQARDLWFSAILLAIGTLLFALGGLVGSLPGAFLASAWFIAAGTGPLNGDGAAQPAYAAIVLAAAGTLAWRGSSRELWKSAWAGAVLGAGLLYRSSLFLFPPVLALVELITRHRGSLRAGWRHLLLVGVLPYLFLLPWIGMNHVLHGRFIPLERHAADLNVATGAQGLVANLPDLRSAPSQDAGGPGVLAEASREILRHPLRYAGACLRRLWLVAGWNPALVLLALAAALLPRRDPQSSVLRLLAAYFLAVHCLMSVERNYFVPFWPLLMALAGSLAARAIQAPPWGEEGLPHRLCAAVIGACSAALVLGGLCASGAALAYSARPGRGDGDGALDRAIAARPREAWLLSERGRARFNAGDREGAVKDFTLALSLQPDDAAREFELGWALAVPAPPRESLRLVGDVNLPVKMVALAVWNCLARDRLDKARKVLAEFASPRALERPGGMSPDAGAVDELVALRRSSVLAVLAEMALSAPEPLRRGVREISARK